MKKILFLIIVLFSFKVQAQYCSIGDLYLSKGDINQAVSYYLGCAESGDIKSQYLSGNFNYLGKGVSKSFTNALRYYRLAAENGFAPAQVKAALMYWRGEGTSQDLVKALTWLILASDGKDRKWFYPAMEDGLAVENEDNKAKTYIKQISKLMTDQQKNAALAKASEIKFNLLKIKAKEILNKSEYNNFINIINSNSNDRKKVDVIIMDLYKKHLSLKKNSEQ